MSEIGALSLRITADGGKDTLAALQAVETQAKKVSAQFADGVLPRGAGARSAADLKRAEAAAADLAKQINDDVRLFGLMARTADVGNASIVADLKRAAAAQLEYMRAIGATEEQQLRMVAATQAFHQRVTAAMPQVVVATRGLSTELTKATGGFTSFGSKGFSALSTVAFGFSQLATGATLSLRSVATSMSGFLALFGTGGAITSIVLTAGLAISDFFFRTRREIQATTEQARQALKGLRASVEEQRRSGDVAGLVDRARKAYADLTDSQKELADVTQKILALEIEVERHRQLQGIVAGQRELRQAGEEQLTTLRERKSELQQIIPLLVRENALALEAARNVRSQPTGPKGLPIRITARGPAPPTGLPDVNLLPRADASKEVVGKADFPGAGAAQIRDKITISISEAHALFTHGLSEEAQRMEEEAQAAGMSIAAGLIGGFASGLAAGNLGDAFKQATSSFLQGLGNFAVQTALEAIKVSQAMIALRALIAAHPVAALAVATTLLVLGRSLGGRNSGGSFTGGGGGASGTTGLTESIRRTIIDPNTRRVQPSAAFGLTPAVAATGPSITVLGIDSPRGIRLIGTANAEFVASGRRK